MTKTISYQTIGEWHLTLDCQDQEHRYEPDTYTGTTFVEAFEKLYRDNCELSPDFLRRPGFTMLLEGYVDIDTNTRCDFCFRLHDLCTSICRSVFDKGHETNDDLMQYLVGEGEYKGCTEGLSDSEYDSDGDTFDRDEYTLSKHDLYYGKQITIQ